MTFEQTLQQLQKSKFWRDKKVLALFGLSLVLNIFLWIYIFFSFIGSQGQTSLHYSILFGVDSIGWWHKLLQLPLAGLLILIINGVLAFYFYLQRRKSLINFLLGSLLAVQIILLISVSLIINL